ncbi:MAG TPA: hypothetical protein DCE18_15400 [Syntrophobacteraceae bacterium]|nr:hypothetical protein [Syntrophobacteraceae bacterium]
MESQMAQALKLKHHPVAIVQTEQEPAGALHFKKGKWGCVMFLFANAARGKTAVFDRETYGCWGGGVGLGFGNVYRQFPGGLECFAHFLSTGNQEWETGRQVGQALVTAAGKEFAEDFLVGERYVKSPELVNRFVDELPIQDIALSFVVFKPLGSVEPDQAIPSTVVFVVNPDQLSALVVLANYARDSLQNVVIPFGAGCQTIGIFPLAEAKLAQPRAVVGLTDLSARKYVRNLLGREYFTFAMPWALFQEMEANVPGSFLERKTWQSLVSEAGSAAKQVD